MTTTVPTPQNVPPVLMPWPATHYGCRVVELGEDGDRYAVAGPVRSEHVADRRAIAAVLHYLRVECSFDRSDMEFGEIKVKQRYVTVVDDDDEPWQWASETTPGASAITYVETW